MIYTIGYSSLGYKEDQIIEALKQLIEELDAHLIDVRDNPFGLANFPNLKKELGGRYHWRKNLGNSRYKKFAYNENIPYENIILMCAEKDHTKCHRTEVAKILREVRGKNEEIKHLFSESKSKNRTLF